MNVYMDCSSALSLSLFAESEFSFQQSTYSVIENVGTTQVCIELVMGVVSQATPVTIVSVAGGTATGISLLLQNLAQ